MVFLFLVSVADAQSVRDRTRPDAPRETRVSDSQALELTLTLTEVGVRTLQTWVRTAASLNEAETLLIAPLNPPDSDFVRIGQRVRAFPPESKSSMLQARVSRVVRDGDRTQVEAEVGSVGTRGGRRFVMEILTERGQFLSIPNEAIIEEDAVQVAYVQTEPGRFVPRIIRTGLQGELYTEVLDGLEEGEQVVTYGSFFIDAEYKLNTGFDPTATADAEEGN